MTAAHPTPPFQIKAASLDQKPLLANLLELYCHDFSEFVPLDIGLNGRFGYKHLDLYWTDPQRFPFLLYVGESLAGFVLVRRISEDTTPASQWDISEFFIMRGFRRRGIGIRVVAEIFARFPGRWEVRVMQANIPACSFWNRASHAFAGDTVRVHLTTASGKEWTVFSFHSPPHR
jgi:predicted acetyltransferase